MWSERVSMKTNDTWNYWFDRFFRILQRWKLSLSTLVGEVRISCRRCFMMAHMFSMGLCSSLWSGQRSIFRPFAPRNSTTIVVCCGQELLSWYINSLLLGWNLFSNCRKYFSNIFGCISVATRHYFSFLYIFPELSPIDKLLSMSKNYFSSTSRTVVK